MPIPKTLKPNTYPALFGITNSNRDFSQRNNWGKNQFNNAFPVALVSFMEHCNLAPVYLKLNSALTIEHNKISVNDLFGVNRLSDNLYFAFERDYAPYQPMIVDKLPRIDLVTMNSSTGACLRGLEIKLTALPDNATCDLSESKYGSELVIRPDTIVYLALSIVKSYAYESLRNFFSGLSSRIVDWTDEKEMLDKLPEFVSVLDIFLLSQYVEQVPLVLHPIWKTKGKSPELADNCLDAFVWSNLSFTRLFIDATKNKLATTTVIDRQMRTTLWLIKMLLDFTENRRINHSWIIDNMTYNTKNDKAFAINGSVTNMYMRSPQLESPRIEKTQLKEIVLNGGHKLLSPERRFDAILFYNPELFEG